MRAWFVFLSESLANMEDCTSEMSSHGWHSASVPLLMHLPEEEFLVFP